MILTSKSKDIYFTVANQPDDKLLLFNILYAVVAQPATARALSL